MKTGILTFHHAKQSYGACLQAYATAAALRSMGYETEIINYENKYEQRQMKDKNASLKTKLVMSANLFARMALFGGWKNPYLKRANLDSVYGCVSGPVYTSAEAMRGLCYDVLVAGSDQVWNPQLTGGVDKAFLLDFGSAERRVSYASSMGSHVLTDSERAAYSAALSRFHAISVREEHAREQLQPIVGKEISVVVDPTLLLSREQWVKALNVRQKANARPYILTYLISANIESRWPEIEPYVKNAALPVYNIQTHGRKSAHTDKALYALTLDEILAYMLGASLIITDSFHGTAFSINFGKEFVAIPNRNNPARVGSLLQTLELSDRLSPTAEAAGIPIDWRKTHELLDLQRDRSAAWLKNAVEG